MDPLDYPIVVLSVWLILSVVSTGAWSFVASRLKRSRGPWVDLAVGLPPVPPITRQDAEWLELVGIDATDVAA